VEDIWSTIKDAILYAMNLHIPMVKIKSHKHHKWYNSDIRKLLTVMSTINCLLNFGLLVSKGIF